MEHVSIRVPDTLFDAWEDAYGIYLHRRYTDNCDERQLIPCDPGVEKDNFIFRGITFIRSGGSDHG